MTLERPRVRHNIGERVASVLTSVVNRCSERRRSISRRRDILSILLSSPLTHIRRRRSGVQASSRKSSESSFRCRRVLLLGPFHGLHFRLRDTTPSPTSGVDAAWCMRSTQCPTSPAARRRSTVATVAFFRAAKSPTPSGSRWSPAGPVRQPAIADTGCDHASTQGSSIDTDAPWTVSCRPPYSP